MSTVREIFGVLQGMNDEVACKGRLLDSRIIQGIFPTVDELDKLEGEAREVDSMIDIFEIFIGRNKLQPT